MGFIREPDGVDFIIAPSSYTDADKAKVSDFLRKHKTSQTMNVMKPSGMKIRRKVFA